MYKLCVAPSDGGTVCVQHVMCEGGPVLPPQPSRWLPGELSGGLQSTVHGVT